ncbi:hypothetical protein OBBRIDRAFT_788858 [Obba rivulosa]|uniref:Protein kinase domain-containing protein n=1 Tax=Obba rivulosa TaxID=1052685 RepID=A0A8E2DSA9_9APHY|nr:hypothetical protein OBBRIDRAFT_788858 [Obba rivulosa]
MSTNHCVEEASANNVPRPKRDKSGLVENELYWRDRQKWLEEKGYLLRSRYRPDWKPSWEGTKKMSFQCEDGLLMAPHPILDAVRVSDKKMVAIKAIRKSVHPYEAEIGQYLSSEPLASDRRNHCIPIYDVLQDPYDVDKLLLIMPFLRPYDNPRFQTVGEAVEFFRQVFQGLHFMHENHVAHRDCMSLNIMMDPRPLFPDMYHPRAPNFKFDLSGSAKRYSRTERPTKYYLVDFGLSRRYTADDASPQELPILGGDKTVPEFRGAGYNKTWNPFHTDVYYLGNVIKECFLQKYVGLHFLEDLVGQMVHEDPLQRPTMTTVVARFDEICSVLTSYKLRARLMNRWEDGTTRFLWNIWHMFRTAGYLLRSLPAQPVVDRAEVDTQMTLRMNEV